VIAGELDLRSLEFARGRRCLDKPRVSHPAAAPRRFVAGEEIGAVGTAQANAQQRLATMRYGDGDYFCINNMQPSMKSSVIL
jgi:hypothetical protein